MRRATTRGDHRNGAEQDQLVDGLGRAWRSLEPRHRRLLEQRVAGDTLAQVGSRLGVTRERVRQLQIRAESALIEAAGAELPGFRETLVATVGARAVVSDHQLHVELRTSSTVALTALLHALGFMRPRTWAGELAGWWTSHNGALDAQLRGVVARAPCSDAELHERLAAAGLPEDLPIEELFGCRRSPVTPGPGDSWVRRSAKSADSAYLWLSSQGEPRSSREIAEAIGSQAVRGLNKSLAQDGRFTRLRPDRTWTLSGWTAARHRRLPTSAVEAVVDVLRDLGPLTRYQLIQETISRYPVSRQWLTQSLTHSLVGRTETGLYDLVERGAVPIVEAAPTRPDTIAESSDGQMITVRLRVDAHWLRGNGIPVSRWLTWRLGLREIPAQRTFAVMGSDGQVVLRRTVGLSILSRMRPIAQSLGVVPGCGIVVVIRPEKDTVDVRHGCTGRGCPARLLS